MAERVSSDNPSVNAIRGTLVRAGGLDRPRIAIPAEEAAHFPVGEVVRLVIDGTERFAPVERTLSGDDLELRGAYETPDGARNPAEGSDRLAAWQDAHDVRFEGSVLVDVVEPDFRYGIRAPGERATYDMGRPDSGLQDIARDLGE